MFWLLLFGAIIGTEDEQPDTPSVPSSPLHSSNDNSKYFMKLYKVQEPGVTAFHWKTNTQVVFPANVVLEWVRQDKGYVILKIAEKELHSDPWVKDLWWMRVEEFVKLQWLPEVPNFVEALNLKQTNQELLQTVERLKKENKTFRDAWTFLQQEKADLVNQVADSVNENNSLKEENEELLQKVERLTKENEGLKNAQEDVAHKSRWQYGSHNVHKKYREKMEEAHGFYSENQRRNAKLLSELKIVKKQNLEMYQELWNLKN